MAILLLDAAHIQRCKSTTNSAWIKLQKATDIRTKTLAAAREIHAFNRDATDTVQSVQVSIYNRNNLYYHN